MRSSSPATDGSMINGSSCDSLQRQIGGGFWKNWHTVEDENLEKIATREDGGREENSSSSSAGTNTATHFTPNDQPIISAPKETSDGVICADPSGGSPPPDFVQFVPSPSSSSRPSSSPKSINTSSESDDQVPSSNLDSSASSERSTVALSRNELKNMRFFIKAINQSKLATPIALEDKLKVLSWLGGSVGNDAGREKSPSPSMSASCSDFPESQERLHRLQITRDSLSFQVAVLSRQVALQREKIQDLEESLGGTSSPKQHVRGAGQSQQKEIEQQLDELRHKYLALEREKTEAERFLIMSNIEADRVCQHSPERKDTEIDELERLQMAVRSLMADNEQKNSLIQTLQNALEEQQRRMLGANLYQQQNGVPSHQLDINEQIRRILLLDDLSLDGSDQSMMAHSSSFPAGLCGQSLRSSSPRRSPQPAPASGPAPARQHFPTSTSFSSSLSHLKTMGMIPPPPLWRVSSPPPTIPPHRFVEEPPTHLPQLEQPSTSSSGRTPASPLARQLAAELDELRQSGMGALLRQPYSSASLPRSIHSKSNSFGACTTNRLRQAVESDDELASARGSVPNSQTLDGHLTAKRLKKGRRARSTLRSFLGRFTHRGNSLQDVRPSPRSAPLSLPPAFPPHGGPSPCFSVRPSISQFVDWDCAHCSRWLTEVGFGDALVGAVRSGRHLLSMPEADFETELGVRSALQRKRLKCMLDRIERNSETEAADKMDTNMVMLWLDQIGLPQLRDSFAENRVNGHLLLVLSMQDLMELGIQSALNHASLARAIQFLRSVDFHLHRLEKHFSSELLLHCPIPAQVERWSHCCVVEWLRSEDLDEFTPNLAFSGLHGALMVYEPTFTAESLAEMLQIPPTKTLIRRHLSTQFNSVLGQQIVGNKRETVSQPMAVHLTPGLRIRLAKGGFSLGRKKSKSDIFVEPEVRVCPEV